VAQKPYTDEQLQQAVDAAAAHGTVVAAARFLGIPAPTMQHRHAAALIKGFTPKVQRIITPASAPEGYKLKGTSTLYGAEGEQKLQWVKTNADEERIAELRRAAFEAMAADLPRLKPVAAPTASVDRFLNLYTITDAHIGMHSWSKETGVDWDLDIAERVISGVFLQMIQSAPAAHTCIVNQMSDFLHTDSLKPVTPVSGHILDADSRYQKIVEVAVRVLRRIMAAALKKHQKVILNILDANHDPTGATWLRVMFSALYEKEPRVKVETSPSPYVAHQHGKVMLAFHHGHCAKNQNLPLLFASIFREIWGATVYRYCHTGHRHHVEEKEHPGMIVIQHPTLAAPDAYSVRAGFDSKRTASSIIYDKEHGQVARQTFVPEMVQ